MRVIAQKLASEQRATIVLDNEHLVEIDKYLVQAP